MLCKEVYLEVPGIPRTQGSTRVFHRKDGTPYVTSANKELKAWRKEVSKAVFSKIIELGQILKGPVYVYCVFELPRPKTVSRDAPCVRPDLDKLVRSVLDSVTAAKAWSDEGQVCQIVALKNYSDTPRLKLYLKEMQ